LAPNDTEAGVIIGCPYGIATAYKDENGAYRWAFHSDSLTVNQRFVVSLLPLTYEAGDYLVGTEDGLLVYRDNAWEPTGIRGTPVRAVIRAHGAYWSGTDTAGIWTSADPTEWRQVCDSNETGAVFDLAATSTGILAATSLGFLQGDGSGTWVSSGPGIRAACVAAHEYLDGHWLGGAYPGGLWMTENAGRSWRQCGSFTKLMSINAEI
jgi:hypothetical protein